MWHIGAGCLRVDRGLSTGRCPKSPNAKFPLIDLLVGDFGFREDCTKCPLRGISPGWDGEHLACFSAFQILPLAFYVYFVAACSRLLTAPLLFFLRGGGAFGTPGGVRHIVAPGLALFGESRRWGYRSTTTPLGLRASGGIPPPLSVVGPRLSGVACRACDVMAHTEDIGQRPAKEWTHQVSWPPTVGGRKTQIPWTQ